MSRSDKDPYSSRQMMWSAGCDVIVRKTRTDGEMVDIAGKVASFGCGGMEKWGQLLAWIQVAVALGVCSCEGREMTAV